MQPFEEEDFDSPGPVDGADGDLTRADDPDDNYVDGYNHPPEASAAADAVTDAEKLALEQQICTIAKQIKASDDTAANETLGVQMAALVEQYELTYRCRFVLDR